MISPLIGLLFHYYKKNWLHVFMGLYRNTLERTSNMVRSSVTHSAASAEPRFFSYHILMSSVIYYWRDAPQNGINLLKFNTSVTSHVMLAIHNSHALRISKAFRAQPKKCAKAKISQWPHSRAKDTWEQLTAYSCDKKKQTNKQSN